MFTSINGLKCCWTILWGVFFRKCHNPKQLLNRKFLFFIFISYGSGQRMITGTCAGSRIKTNKKSKRTILPHHKSQRCEIWCVHAGLSYLALTLTSWTDLCPIKGSSGELNFCEVSIKHRRSFGNHIAVKMQVFLKNGQFEGDIIFCHLYHLEPLYLVKYNIHTWMSLRNSHLILLYYHFISSWNCRVWYIQTYFMEGLSQHHKRC